MGVGIFAARKIALLNSINNIEMMITQLSSRQMSLAQESMNIAMQQNNIQSSMLSMGAQQQQGVNWGGITQGLSGLGGALGGSEYGQIGSAIGSGIGMIGSLLANRGGNGGMDSITQSKQQQIALDNKLLQLQQQEKRLEMTMKTLETQLSMKNKELESVDKAEDRAIQRSAPKYGEA